MCGGFGPARFVPLTTGLGGSEGPSGCRLFDALNLHSLGDPYEIEAMVAWKKVVVAAEQGVLLINTAFTEDMFWLKLALAQAGAGTSAWAGLVDVDRREYRAGYYALRQLVGYLDGYESITRLALDEEGVRVKASNSTSAGPPRWWRR